MTAIPRISPDEALALFDLPLWELGRRAEAARFALHPEPRVTFVLDRNITYTNVCGAACRFCAYHVAPGSPRGFVMAPEEAAAKARELAEMGGTQVMLQGGLHPGLGLDYYRALLAAVTAEGVVAHSLSPPEIDHLARKEGMDLRELIRELRAAGLASLPGGGAEILVDRVRSIVSPLKMPADRWFAVMRAAHAEGMKSTATMVFGHAETLAERIEHLARVRDLQDETGGFRAFIPWPFQPGNTAMRDLPRTGGVDYLKTVAVSRLFLDNVGHIHSGWVTEGEKMAQVALRFGADDLGGTLFEEVVVRSTGVDHRMSVDVLKRVAEGAGFRLARRDTEYRVLETL